jgi:hypothetical protein
MKRHWEVDELIEHWTLLPDEEALLEPTFRTLTVTSSLVLN